MAAAYVYRTCGVKLFGVSWLSEVFTSRFVWHSIFKIAQLTDVLVTGMRLQMTPSASRHTTNNEPLSEDNFSGT
jgi:hypothetical protein